MRYLRQTPLRDNDILAMLIEDITQNYKIQLIVARIKTPVDWFSVALQLETTMSKKYMSEQFRTNRPQATNFAMQTTRQNSKPKVLRKSHPSMQTLHGIRQNFISLTQRVHK